MARINRSEVMDAMKDGLRLDVAVDKIPNQLAEKVVPIFNCKERRLILVSGITAVNSTSAIIFTTSATKRTFIIGAVLSYSRDAGATSTSSYINATPFGFTTTRTILELRYNSGAADRNAIILTLPQPMELKKSSNVSVYNATGDANISAEGIIYYYEEEP